MKTIGTDISLDVCKDEGYLMVQFDARKKFNQGESYRVLAYYPSYIEEFKNELIINTWVSFDSLKETYTKYKKELNSFSETDMHVNFNNPTIYDLLNLANDISSYCGLD